LCADKIYLSRRICNVVPKDEGRPYISIKKDVTKIRSTGSSALRDDRDIQAEQKLSKARNQRRSLAGTAGIHSQVEVQSHSLTLG